MYKNRTIYDLELLLLSQQGMIKQTRIISAIFAIIILAIGIVCFFMERVLMGVCLVVASVLIIILFVILCDWFLKLTMQKNIKNRSIEVEYLFSNNLTITSYADGQTSTQSFEYSNVFQMVESAECLLICPGKQDALIMRKDEEFNDYRNFIMDKMGDRYFVEKSVSKKKSKKSK